MRAPTRWAVLAAVVVLVLSGCTADEHPGDGPVADPPPVDTTDRPPRDTGPSGDQDAAGTDAGPLAFSARSLDGGTVDASELAGQHVVLWMWTPW